MKTESLSAETVCPLMNLQTNKSKHVHSSARDVNVFLFPALLPASGPSKDQWMSHVLTLNGAWPLASSTEPGVGVLSLREAD